MTDRQHPGRGESERARRGPRLVEVLFLALLPVFIFLVDLEAAHRAGHPRSRFSRLRAYLARGVRPRR